MLCHNLREKKEKTMIRTRNDQFFKYLQNNNNVEASLFDFRPYGGWLNSIAIGNLAIGIINGQFGGSWIHGFMACR